MFKKIGKILLWVVPMLMGISIFSTIWEVVQNVGRTVGAWIGLRPTFFHPSSRVDDNITVCWMCYGFFLFIITWFLRFALENWKTPREFGKDLWRVHTRPWLVGPILGALAWFVMIPMVEWCFEAVMDWAWQPWRVHYERISPHIEAVIEWVKNIFVDMFRILVELIRN